MVGSLSATANAFQLSSAAPKTVDALVSQYGLSQSYSLPQPSSALSSSRASSYLKEEWSLNRQQVCAYLLPESRQGHCLTNLPSLAFLASRQIQAGANYLSFADDPFDSSSSDAVLEIDYEQGSFGGDGNGGAQFYVRLQLARRLVSQGEVEPFSRGPPLTGLFCAPRTRLSPPFRSSARPRSQAQPLNGSSAPLSSMLLSYDVGFSPAFAFSQGGKLPGLRGGPDPRGCSGGHEADGGSCFSSRLMWRSGGAGEVCRRCCCCLGCVPLITDLTIVLLAQVYAYIPTKGYGLCTASDVTCNSDYGTSCVLIAISSFAVRPTHEHQLTPAALSPACRPSFAQPLAGLLPICDRRLDLHRPLCPAQ